MSEKKGKITGIGGIFFKSEAPKKLMDWYSEALGLPTGQYGHTFEWGERSFPKTHGFTQWSVFKSETDYLDPSKKDYMVNYRVENLVEFLEELKSKGVQLVGEMQEFEYGKFAWAMDPDGNKLEFWEPNDEVYAKMADDAASDSA